jgi:hypothetical protein
MTERMILCIMYTASASGDERYLTEAYYSPLIAYNQALFARLVQTPVCGGSGTPGGFTRCVLERGR